MKPTGPTNPLKKRLIIDLEKKSKKEKKAVWKYVAEILSKPRRNAVSVNLSKINRYAKDGDIIIVPGKILADGDLTKKVRLISEKISSKALDYLNKNKVEYSYLYDIIDKKIDTKNLRIIK